MCIKIKKKKMLRTENISTKYMYLNYLKNKNFILLNIENKINLKLWNDNYLFYFSKDEKLKNIITYINENIDNDIKNKNFYYHFTNNMSNIIKWIFYYKDILNIDNLINKMVYNMKIYNLNKISKEIKNMNFENSIKKNNYMNKNISINLEYINYNVFATSCMLSFKLPYLKNYFQCD